MRREKYFDTQEFSSKIDSENNRKTKERGFYMKIKICNI